MYYNFKINTYYNSAITSDNRKLTDILRRKIGFLSLKAFIVADSGGSTLHAPRCAFSSP